MKIPVLEKSIKFKPHRKLRNLWLIMWAGLTLVCYVLPVILLFIFFQEKADTQRFYNLIAILSTIMVPLVVYILIWSLLFYKSLKYIITNTHITITSGVIWRKVREIPFIMITDVVSVQGPLERFFHLGHLNIQTAGHGGETQAEGVIRGVHDYISKRQELIGRINKYKSIQDVTIGREEGQNNMVNLLTGILNEMRELRKQLSGKK